MKLGCRLHLSSLEVRWKDGQVFFVPWPKVIISGDWLHVPAASVGSRGKRARGIAVDNHTACVAWRLRARVLWRTGAVRFPCPTVRRAFIRASVVDALLAITILPFVAFMAWSIWTRASAGSYPLPAWIRLGGAVVVWLMGAIVLLVPAVPFVALWPYLVLRWHRRDLAELRATPDALVYVRTDGSEAHLPWERLTRFTGDGRLEFSECSESPLQIDIAVNAKWHVLGNWLLRTHHQAFSSSLTWGALVRRIVVFAIAAIGSELLLRGFMAQWGLDSLSPGSFLLVVGVMVGPYVVISLASGAQAMRRPDLSVRRRSAARARRKRLRSKAKAAKQ